MNYSVKLQAPKGKSPPPPKKKKINFMFEQARNIWLT